MKRTVVALLALLLAFTVAACGSSKSLSGESASALLKKARAAVAAEKYVSISGKINEGGKATYTPANKTEVSNVGGYQTFRQLAWAGSFEGYTSLGLGVRARLPFRVFTLAGPDSGSRLVIDVAHYW